MSYIPPTPDDLQGLEIRGAAINERIEQEIKMRDLLDRNDEGVSEPPRRPSVAERLRRLFRSGPRT